MTKGVFMAAAFGLLVVAGAVECTAANWVKNSVDIPNMNVESNYYDADTIKVNGKTLSWTEQFNLTELGSKSYTKHLAQYPVCKENIQKKGDVTYHQIDFELKEGNYRTVAKRNYNKKNELICTNKDMGTEFDTAWKDVVYGSPMYNRYYIFVTTYKLGNI